MTITQKKPEIGDEVTILVDVYADIANIDRSSKDARGRVIGVDPASGRCEVEFCVDKIVDSRDFWPTQLRFPDWKPRAGENIRLTENVFSRVVNFPSAMGAPGRVKSVEMHGDRRTGFCEVEFTVGRICYTERVSDLSLEPAPG